MPNVYVRMFWEGIIETKSVPGFKKIYGRTPGAHSTAVRLEKNQNSLADHRQEVRDPSPGQE